MSVSFSCKSYLELLRNDLNLLDFNHFDSVWECPSPSKVKVLKWLIVHGKVNTLDRIELNIFKLCLSPNWCVLCKRNLEDINHLFLHCSIAHNLWSKHQNNMSVHWTIPRSCNLLLLENFNLYGNSMKAKKATLLWSYGIGAILWVLWSEMNSRILKKTKNESNIL